MPEGDRLAAASQNDSIRPTAGVELYTAAAMVICFIEPTIFPSMDAVTRLTDELRRGARASLRLSSCNSTKDNMCVRPADHIRVDNYQIQRGYGVEMRYRCR